MIFSWRRAVVYCLAGGLIGAGSGLAFGADVLPYAQVRLNDLQYVGTHNSYHVAPDGSEFDLMLRSGYRQSENWPAAKLVQALAYTHPPLETQLEMGLRVFELDVHDDPQGGRYADPGILKALKAASGAQAPALDPEEALREPGMKVFHANDIDVRSRCLRFVECLRIIRNWSQNHPGHLPVFVEIETKAGYNPPLANAYVPVEMPRFDHAAWDRLQTEILSVFTPGELLRPEDVQGSYPSLNAAVRAEGWPKLSVARGRIVFLLLDDPPVQNAYVSYIAAGHAPVLFPSRSADDPLTAWIERPKPDVREISRLVAQGFLVYTRADANLREPLQGDMSRAKRAFASGAQLIATDVPVPEERFGAYQVSFDGRHVRCNPVRKAAGCGGSLQWLPLPKNLE